MTEPRSDVAPLTLRGLVDALDRMDAWIAVEESTSPDLVKKSAWLAVEHAFDNAKRAMAKDDVAAAKIDLSHVVVHALRILGADAERLVRDYCKTELP